MTLSNHPNTNHHTLTAFVVRLGFIGIGFGVIGLSVVGIGFGLPLMVLMIPFLLGLGIPLFNLTSLHPAIAVEENGLRLTPLVWRSSFIAWEDIDVLTTHTLLQPTPPERRLGRPRKKQTVHEGYMLVASALPWHYRFIGLIAGEGFRPTFAFSNLSHDNYSALKYTVKSHLQDRERKPDQPSGKSS